MDKSIDVTNLLIEEFKISMETTGGDASWMNGKNKIHNKSIHKMVKSGLLDKNQHAKKWFCAAETPSEVHTVHLETTDG